MNCFPDSKSSTNSMLKANLGGIGFFLYVVNFVEIRNYFVTVWPSRHRCKRFWICVAHARVGVSGFLSDWMLIWARVLWTILFGHISTFLSFCSSEPGVYGPFLSDIFSFHLLCSSEPGVLVAVPCDRLVPHLYAHRSQGSFRPLSVWLFSHTSSHTLGSSWPYGKY